MTAGHSMMPGTRRPPSYTVPLLPRSPPTVSGLIPERPPLSLQNTSSVSSAMLELAQLAAERADGAVHRDQFAVMIRGSVVELRELRLVVRQGSKRTVGRAEPDDGEQRLVLRHDDVRRT